MVLGLSAYLVFPALMAFAASMDLFTMTIPNRISIALIAAFFLFVPFTGLGINEIALHATAGLAMLIIGFSFFSFGWIGGGDAKLFAAIALWFGFEHLLAYTILATIGGGFLTLFILFMRTVPLPVGVITQDWLIRIFDTERGIPYGIALAGAALYIYPQTAWQILISG